MSFALCFVPLSWHYLQARDARVRQHFGLAHAAHARQRFAQPVGSTPDAMVNVRLDSR